MNANFIGKTLVLINLALSLLFMTFAMGIFLQQLDWGWKEPRKDVTGQKRIPSEIDKRIAAVVESRQAVALVLPVLKGSQDTLSEAEPYFPANHLWYGKELDRLEKAPGDIIIKDLKIQNGIVALETPNKPLGKPVLENPLPGLTKSYAEYSVVYNKLGVEINKALTEIDQLVIDEKSLTFNLNGRDDAGKVVRKGLLELLENEHQTQVRLKFEKSYLVPHWVAALEEVDLFRERRQRLEATLNRLKKARTRAVKE